MDSSPQERVLVLLSDVEVGYSISSKSEVKRAMRLDPFSAHRYYLDLVRALFMVERPADATVVLERTARTHWEHYLWLAACYAAADRQTAAHEAGRQAVALRPNLSITAYTDGRFAWRRAEDKARLRAAAIVHAKLAHA
jgi:hypothetical protein